MGQKFIVLAHKPDGSVEMLADPSVEFGKMKAVLHKNTRDKKFSEVQMFMLQPHTRAIHPAATLKMEADIKANEEAAKKTAEQKAKKDKEAEEKPAKGSSGSKAAASGKPADSDNEQENEQ